MTDINNVFFIEAKKKVKGLLLEQYKENSDIINLIAALTYHSLEVKNILNPILRIHNKDTSVGSNLDVLGKIVGQTRKAGESDKDYLISIDYKIGVNNSRGTLNDMISSLNAIFGTDSTFFQTGHRQLRVEYTRELSASDSKAALNLLNMIAPAGVEVQSVNRTFGAGTFSFAGEGAGLGFGSLTNSEIGGKFASIQAGI